MPTRRKSLVQLKEEWSDCTKCELGVRRKASKGKFVFGEGNALRGVMFIGEGPGRNEEVEGRPFCGDSGVFLREMINIIGLEEHFYITNTVACRSCQHDQDGEGNLRFHPKSGRPVIKDERPTPQHINECIPRLYEEIYLVDPKVIVTLGVAPAEALTRKSIGIKKESGRERTIEIPGAWQVPVLTEKKKVWVRKHRGEIIAPTRQHMVKYLMIPVMHPAYVLIYKEDKRPDNPLERFYRDMQKVAAVYKRLVAETDECATE